MTDELRITVADLDSIPPADPRPTSDEILAYLDWVEMMLTPQELTGASHCCVASDGSYFFGSTYRAAVLAAMAHDKDVYALTKDIKIITQ